MIKSSGVILLLLIVISGLLIYDRQLDQKNEQTDFSLSGQAGVVQGLEERARWEKRIDVVGANQAYEEYKAEYADKHFGIQHTVAHIVGELLYEKLGLDGMAVCDSTFAFGCYHSFFGQALSNHGVSIVRELDEICIDKYGEYGTGCQHGIGHGLLEYFGHSQLVKALETCSLTTQKKSLFGCTSGVFMEYNVPIIVGENTAVTQERQIDFQKSYEPCPSVEDRFQKSCYYELGQWWDKASTYDGDYTKIGELCHAIKEDENRESCFLGVGNVAAPSSQYVVEETISKCQNMPEFQEQVTCRSGASWSFFASPAYRRLSAKVCEGLPADVSRRCALESNLIGTTELK